MTAERILQESYSTKPDIDHPYKLYWKEDVLEAMKEFAELKCKELLEIVAEKVRIIEKTPYIDYETKITIDKGGNIISVDKGSILNAVNLKEFIQ
jgi:hypothetical protein